MNEELNHQEISQVENTENTDKVQVEISPEEKERMEEVKALVEAEELEPTTAMNIIINAVQLAFDSEIFNDLDRYLIAKSLNTFKKAVDAEEDIILKVK